MTMSSGLYGEGSGKVKSCKDHDGAQGCELSHKLEREELLRYRVALPAKTKDMQEFPHLTERVKNVEVALLALEANVKSGYGTTIWEQPLQEEQVVDWGPWQAAKPVVHWQRAVPACTLQQECNAAAQLQAWRRRNRHERYSRRTLGFLTDADIMQLIPSSVGHFCELRALGHTVASKCTDSADRGSEDWSDSEDDSCSDTS